MKVILNKWLGHKDGFENNVCCDRCGNLATVAILDHRGYAMCAGCLYVAQQAINKAVLKARGGMNGQVTD